MTNALALQHNNKKKKTTTAT